MSLDIGFLFFQTLGQIHLQGGKKMKSTEKWISFKEAYTTAQVTPFEAKKYLDTFSRFIPNTPLIKGNLVSSNVPTILIHFKKMELLGCSTTTIEKLIQKNISPSNICECSSSQCKIESLASTLNKLIYILKNQAEIQRYTVEIFHAEITLLKEKINMLENKTIDKKL